VRRLTTLLIVLWASACGTLPHAADPLSDAPEVRGHSVPRFKQAPSYRKALELWRTPEDVNAWIGARFQYDGARALLLSETQRSRSKRISIRAPGEFFEAPSGVCVDLARFAVETLRAIAPETRPRYLMLEFAPVVVAGNTLRRHWLASFLRDGSYYVFADSKRPGRLSGPYPSLQAFVDEYANYRGRRIVAFQDRDSYERAKRALAAKRTPEPRR
jgi:hypothetical protein